MKIGGSYKKRAHCSTKLVMPTSMIMDTRNMNNIFPLIGLYLRFVLLVNADIDASCPGPRKHYEEVGCTPVFKTPDAKCPERYNCDHLKNLPTDKCFINGHSYEFGEELRDEDKKPCDIGCTCSSGYGGGLRFNCLIIDCMLRPQPGCYLKHNATDCCGSLQVCPEKPEDRPTCVVDGKTYKDGEYFEPAGDPGKYCYCGEGYTGQNVAPFCVNRTNVCDTMLRNGDDVRNNCAPIYYSNQSPKTDCSVTWRCQNSKDAVIERKVSGESKFATSAPANPDMQCTFGNLTMNVGDELNHGTNWDSVCIRCVCEVPPVLTCQRLSDDKCDVTKEQDIYIQREFDIFL